jgi:hypothetical protein
MRECHRKTFKHSITLTVLSFSNRAGERMHRFLTNPSEDGRGYFLKNSIHILAAVTPDQLRWVLLCAIVGGVSVMSCRQYTALVQEDSREWLANGSSAAYTRCVTEAQDRSKATLERLLRRHVTVFQVRHLIGLDWQFGQGERINRIAQVNMLRYVTVH